MNLALNSPDLTDAAPQAELAELHNAIANVAVTFKRAALTDGSKQAINVEAELAKKTVSEVTGIVAAKYAEMLVDAKGNVEAMAAADAWYYDAMKKVSAAATTAVNDNSKSIGDTAKSTGDTIASSMTAGYNAAWDASKKSVDGQINNLTLLENKAKDAATALAAANAENPYGTTGFTSLEQFSAKNSLDDANKALEFAKEISAGDAAIKQTQNEFDAWNKRLYGSANGNVFDSGNIVPFASGGAFDSGVVTAPTYFPMAGGKTGLMGEAGPEAVIPLERDSSGRLGLAGGETHVHVGGITINAPAGSDPKAIAQAVVAEINKLGAAGKPVLHTNTLKSRTAMNG